MKPAVNMRVWCVAFVACSVLVASVIARPGSKVNRHKRSRQMSEDVFEVREPRVHRNQRQEEAKFIDDYFNGKPIRNRYEEFETEKRSGSDEDEFESDEEDYSDNDYYDDEEEDIEEESRSREETDTSRVDDDARRPPPFVTRRGDEPKGHEKSFSEETNYDDLFRENPVPKISSRDMEAMIKLCIEHCSGPKLGGKNDADIRSMCECDDGHEAQYKSDRV